MNYLRISFVIVAVFVLKVIRSVPVSQHETAESKIVDTSEAKNFYRDHYKFMQRKGRCSEPQGRIIHIQNVLPDQTKRYTPDCTFLHRCSIDTGCCPAGKICGPAEKEEVTLYFTVFKFQPNGGARLHTEAITLMNHTRCECMNTLEISR